MPLCVKFTDLPLGAEISDVDLSGDLDEATFDTIKRTLDERSVIVVRDQRIGPDSFVRFAERFGKLLVHPHNDNTGLPNYPAVLVLSNIIENGKLIGLPDAGLVWHTDGSYLSTPDMYTFLYGIEIPEQNGMTLGNTLYASTAAAYEALPAATKRKIDALQAVHSFAYHAEHRARQKGGVRVEMTDELKKKVPDRAQPIVRTHPITGRKCVYVTEGHTTHIVGMDPHESASLLRELHDHIHRPEFIYRHKWRVGDLLVWDNAATQHLATRDYALPQRRLMYRVATEGTAPF